MSHTKGSWVLDESRHDGCINRLDPFRHIAMVSGYQMHEGDRAENEANARLIAAAPDLLEALEALLDRVQLDGDSKNWFAKEQHDAMAAIDKARGNIQ